MPKIAIVFGDYRHSDDDDYNRVIASITDWAEVSKEELKILKDAEWHEGYQVLVQPDNQVEFINNTVAKWLEIIKEKEEKRKERQAKANATRAKKAAEEAKKKEEKEKKLLEELQAKYGKTSVGNT